MKNTTNYSLKLPEGHDKYNVQDFNGNTEKIDIELKSHADAIDDRYNKTEVDNKFSMHEMNVDWKESVDTFDDIATIYPNPENGWTVNAKDTNYTYRYDGTAWVAISANAIPKATEQLDGLMGKEKVTEINSINYRLGKAEGIVYTCDTKCYGEAPYLRFLVEEVTSISMDIEIIELHYTNPETGNEVNIDTGRTDIYINYLGTKPFEIEICVGKRFFPEPEEGEQPKIGRCKLIIKDNISDLTEQNKKDINELNVDLDSTKTEVGRKANSDELAKTNNLLKDYLITREFSVQYNIPGNSTANYAVNPPVVSGYKLLYCFCNITNTGQVTCHYCDTNRVYFWNHAANAKSAIAILRAIYIRN